MSSVVQDCKCVPVAFEPLSCHKAAVLTVIVRLPTGDDEFSPPDQCGIAIGSSLVTLGSFLSLFCCRTNEHDLRMTRVRQNIFDLESMIAETDGTRRR